MTIPDELGSRVWWRIPGLPKTIKAAGIKFPKAEAEGSPAFLSSASERSLNDNLVSEV